MAIISPNLRSFALKPNWFCQMLPNKAQASQQLDFHISKPLCLLTFKYKVIFRVKEAKGQFPAGLKPGSFECVVQCATTGATNFSVPQKSCIASFSVRPKT